MSSTLVLFASLILVSVLTSTSASAQSCSMANWWQSFDREGYSTCDNSSQYMTGLYRNTYAGIGRDKISLLEEAKCCEQPQAFKNEPTNCYIADWSTSFNTKYTWSICKEGYFLQGLYRSQGDYLDSIEYGKCCKPASHANTWNSCMEQDMMHDFKQKGLTTCPDDYYIAGPWRKECKELSCMVALRCCKMFKTKEAIRTTSRAREVLMDSTRPGIALLAHYLGYGYCASCRAQYVGEDFKKFKSTDKWEADTAGSCVGTKSHVRLSIHYGDMWFKVSDVQYGNPIVQELPPEVYTPCNCSTSGSDGIVDVRSVRRVTHTPTSPWNDGYNLRIRVPYTTDSNEVYRMNYVSGKTTLDSTSKEQHNSFAVRSSASEFRVVIYRRRRTVAYTATVRKHFSATLEGFLRYGGGYAGDSPNFHSRYQQNIGSWNYPTPKFNFGHADKSFYNDLKEQSVQSPTKEHPWMWNALKAKYSHAQTLIDALTDERRYLFTLSGRFEDVIGYHAEIQYKTNGKYPDVNNNEPPRVFPKSPSVVIGDPLPLTIPSVEIKG